MSTAPYKTNVPVTSHSVIRDRDYLLDENGLVFKVIGDTHPSNHYLGYVKYYPDNKGDRKLFDKTYRQNSVVSKSFGILSGQPDYYVYSNMLGCVITGIPRQKAVGHYSCSQALEYIHDNPESVSHTLVGQDLLQLINHIYFLGQQHLFGVTGSFLVGCFNKKSDIDLVCYGREGYEAAKKLFQNTSLIRPYTGEKQTQLYIRRAKYMLGNDYDMVLKQESRKIQGLTVNAEAHINCEPLRKEKEVDALGITDIKEIGEIQLIAKIIDDRDGIFTPAAYKIKVKNILSSTIDEPGAISDNINYMISYLGAYTGAFRKNDIVYIKGKLVHVQRNDGHCFGIELTPWSHGEEYSAQLFE